LHCLYAAHRGVFISYLHGILDLNHEAEHLNERFSYLFHQISARLSMIGNRHFRQYSLNHFSARILVLLLEKKEMRTGELVEMMALPQSTISTQLLGLHKRRLIHRRRSRQDNRSVIVTLSKDGEVLARNCDGLSRSVHKLLTEAMTEEEYEAGYAFLNKVNAHLAGMENRELYRFDDEPA